MKTKNGGRVTARTSPQHLANPADKRHQLTVGGVIAIILMLFGGPYLVQEEAMVWWYVGFGIALASLLYKVDRSDHSIISTADTAPGAHKQLARYIMALIALGYGVLGVIYLLQPKAASSMFFLVVLMTGIGLLIKSLVKVYRS